MIKPKINMEIFLLLPWVLTTLIIFFMSLIVYSRRKSSSSNVVYKLPPNPPKLPIIGNLHHLHGQPRPQALWKLSQKYGPIFHLYIGSKPLLVISSSAMAKQVMKTQDHIFCSRPNFKATKRLTYNFLDIAFSPQSSLRREKRKILVSEFLGPKKAKSFNQILVLETESMVRSLSLLAADDLLKKDVNVSNIFLTTVKEVVCKAAFGMNYKEKPSKLGLSWQEILDEASLMLNGSLGDNFPWLGEIFDIVSGWNTRLEKCFANLDAYIQMIVDEHLNQKIEEICDEDKDFVHRLIELSSNENASNHRLTRDDMKAVIMNVFTGGIDTTVSSMEWTMSEVARNPRVMHKLQNEIRNTAGKIRHVREMDITNMIYLKMVVKESLRLHPPAPLLVPHECFSHCQIGGYDVLPGTSAILNVWGIGRDPSVWGENAEEFYPERFENLDVDFGVGNFEMAPFGAGRRSCPAMNTAPITVEFVIANLLYWFDWEVPNGTKNEDLDMEEEGTLIVHKKSPLCLVPTDMSMA